MARHRFVEGAVETLLEHWHLVAYVGLGLWAIMLYATASPGPGDGPVSADELRGALRHLDHLFMVVLGFVIVNAVRRATDGKLDELLQHAETRVHPQPVDGIPGRAAGGPTPSRRTA
jgi:hypothetical protein